MATELTVQTTSPQAEEDHSLKTAKEGQTVADNEERFDYGNPTINRVAAYFMLHERGTSFLTELLAGCVTFVSMAYILAVNASIIADSGGPCDIPEDWQNAFSPDLSTNPSEWYDFYECQDVVRYDLITATAASACLTSIIMGLSANMPLGMAPGMGINAYFSYTVVGFYADDPAQKTGINYQTALCAVFLEGVIFLILSVTGIRIYIAKMIPRHLKSSISVGIGMFLALIGLQSAEGFGLVVSDAATNVTLGGCGALDETTDAGRSIICPPGTRLEGGTTWLGILGFMIIIVCMIRKVKGAMIIGIFFVAIISWFRDTEVTYFPDTVAGNARYYYFKKVVNFHAIEKTGFVLFDDVDFSSAQIWVALFTMLYVDILDTTGTLYSMADFSGLVDKNGDFPRSGWAFSSDAIGTIIGSLMGTTDTTAYIESGAGINAGGRTGLTAVVVGLLFFLSLFFNPIFASIPPWATGGALVVVGALMMDSVNKVDWADMRQAFPAFVTIIIMPFTYSIAYGIIGGLVMHGILVALDFLFDRTPVSGWFCCCCCCACGKSNAEKNDDV